MRVYVETNFILELVYEQEQASACELILGGAERGALQLRIPALCAFEAVNALQRRVEKRKEKAQILSQEAREIQRQKPFAGDGSASAFLGLLTRSTQHLENQLKLYLERIHRCAVTIPLGAQEAELAHSVWSAELDDFDALVMGCIDSDLQRVPTQNALFANRNSNDFKASEFKSLAVKKRLQQENCRLINSFDDAVAFLCKGQHLPP